ncbi:exosome non-catalytic core subunit [Saccharomycopsis crataegensis]|uniref:Exosome non-catalytic core subunit n=1 Tax=Saccharomycopsis crataegensis TaxID=43959 RepID=A0AAV5QMR0_9ASCO|nr:exosome non-catalytic core subunit [Saccharomycopsis crataegensis]
MSVEIPRVVVPGQPIVPEFDTASHSADHTITQARKYLSGPGTTLSKIPTGPNEEVNAIVATLKGKTVISPKSKDKTSSASKDELPVNEFLVSVVNHQTPRVPLPKEGDYVLCRVMKLTSRQAFVEILSVDNQSSILADSGVGSNGSLGMAGGTSLVANVSSGSVAGTSVFSQAVGATNASLGAHPADLGESFRGLIRVQDIRATERDKTQVVESFMPGDIVRAEVINIGDGASYYLSTAKNELGVVLSRSHGGRGDMLYPLDYETMVSVSGHIEKRKVAKPF